MPAPVDRREHLPRQRDGPARGVIDWNRTNHEAARAARPGRPATRTRPPRSCDIGVGKQQLVEIAKALSKDVKLLILDEPTAALNDERLRSTCSTCCAACRREGITSIIISPQAQRDRADRRRDHDHPRRQDDRDARRQGRRRRPRTGSSAGMVGRDLEHRYPTTRPTIGEELLEIEDWTVAPPAATRPRVVVDDANLTVRRGEIVGIAGLMGAGRTELAMSVFGRSYGTDISGHGLQARQGDRAAARCPRRSTHGIAYVTEDRKTLRPQPASTTSSATSRSAALGKLARRGCGRRATRSTASPTSTARA